MFAGVPRRVDDVLECPLLFNERLEIGDYDLRPEEDALGLITELPDELGRKFGAVEGRLLELVVDIFNDVLVGVLRVDERLGESLNMGSLPKPCHDEGLWPRCDNDAEVGWEEKKRHGGES